MQPRDFRGVSVNPAFNDSDFAFMKPELPRAELKRRIALLWQFGELTDSVQMGWYCLSVMTGREQAVENSLKHFGLIGYVPMRKKPASYVRGKPKLPSEQPVMRSYVLTKLPIRSAVFMAVKGIRNVIDVVGGAINPVRISDNAINEFKVMADNDGFDHQDRVVRYCVGEQVKVSSGPFQGMTGTVMHARCNALGDLKVEAGLFNQKVEIILPLAFLEKL